MPQLVIFIGLPGSGKSTYFQSHFAKSHVHVSKDLKSEKLLNDALASGRDVVVDNTSPTKVVRAPLIAAGKRCGARVIAYYFECSVKQCLVRNRGREGKARVPDVAIFATAKKLQAPSLDEGFDEVHVVPCE